MKLNKSVLKPYTSVSIIAETASSHEGDVDIAKKMADAVRDAGADAIKYQFLKAESLLVPSHHKYESFKELEFSEDEWNSIIDYAKSIGLFIIAEVFDDRSFEFANGLGIEVFKIPTSDLSNPFLLPKAASTGKVLILSVGAATEGEIDFAIKTCEQAGNNNLILMHGFQNFPTKIEDTNFQLLDYLKKTYNYPIGFADHIDAELDIAFSLPLVAIGFGATIIEKHITLDRSKKGRDYYSALNPDEFAHMVDMIKNIEKAYGTLAIGCSEAEITYRKLMKKKIVAAKDIPKGAVISKDDLVSRRTDEDGLVPIEYNKILKKTKELIPRYAAIREEHVE